MTSLDPVATPFLIGSILIGLFILYWLDRYSHRQTPVWLRRSLFALRAAMVAAIVVILLNPVWTLETPDEEAYTVAILGQNSGSMLVVDAEQASRLDWIRAELDADPESPNLRARLSAEHPLRLFTFADSLRPIGGTDFQLQPAPTAIGDSLEDLYSRPAPRGSEWGAVLLLSDGVQQQGRSPIAVARSYGEEGVPIHVVGVGDDRSTGDLSVRFVQRELQGTRGQALDLDVRVENRFASRQPLTLELWEEDEMVAEREIELAGGEQRQESFSVEPSRSGFRSYRVRLDSPARPRNPSTDTDYATAQVEEAAGFRILYLGRPNWEYRFLRILFDNEERYTFKAWLHTGPEQFLLRGFDEPVADGRPDHFPDDVAAFDDIDSIFLDARSLEDLPAETRAALVDFVSRAGGGLLVTGPVNPENVDDSFRALLPARDFRNERFRDDRRLNPLEGPVLRDEDLSVYTRSPAVFHAQSRPAWIPQRMARGARTALETQDGEPFLVYHAYGAGRVAYQASEEFWRWRMQSQSGSEQHRRFWLTLFNWLCESREPRLLAPLQGQVRALNEPAPLQVRVLDNAFRPRADARVRARITDPEGNASQRTLLPRFGEPGYYDNEWELTRPGEYRVRYEVEFAEGETLSRDVFFAAVADEAQQDQALNEGLLRDIARLSGGNYYPAGDAERIEKLPLADRVPMIETPIHWARSVPFISLLLALAAADWYLRRRYGLK